MMSATMPPSGAATPGGGHAMHAVAFIALMLLILDFDPFWAANALFVGAMLAGLVSTAVKFLTYRGGM